MGRMISLYHGTTIFFTRPSLDKAKPYKDFGKGFYLTTSFSQTKKWAVRNLSLNDRKSVGYVYKYGFDLDDAKLLNCLDLLSYDETWVNTISWYRNNLETNIEFDLIYDRMADGRYRELTDVLQRYDRGLAEVADVLDVARFNKKTGNDQYCFKTKKALACLCKLGVATISITKESGSVITWHDANGKEYTGDAKVFI